jgi:hypothetical protein
MKRLKGLIAFSRQENNAGQCRQRANERGPSVAAPGNEKRGLQNHPVQIQRHQMRVTPALGFSVFGRHPFASADRRNLNDFAQSQIAAGIEKRRRPEMMDPLGIDTRPALQNTGTIHDGIKTGEPLNPDSLAGIGHEVAGNGVDGGPLAPKRLGVTYRCGDTVPGTSQRGQKMAADETVRTGQQNFQNDSLSPG